MHRTAATLVDYWSTKAESWKKKKNMIPKAQPHVLHTLMVITASSALRLSKTGKDDKKWCSLTETNMHWSENSLEKRGEGSYRTSAGKQKAYRSGICLLKHERAPKKVHSKVPIAIKTHLCGFLGKDKRSRAFSRRQAGPVFNYKTLY